MLEPEQLGLRRLWLTAGHMFYTCRDLIWPPDDYKPLAPGAFDVATCVTNRDIWWDMERPGSITGLTMFLEVAPDVGENVRARVRYMTGGGGPFVTDYLRLITGEHSGWVRWIPGTYAFEVGALILIEHVSWTNASPAAENLVCIVEVALAS